MSTHCSIGYETADGGYIGVYVHFDGYPEWTAPRLRSISWDEVTFQVNRAIMKGGGRCIDDLGEIVPFDEPPNQSLVYDEWPCHQNEFNYRKRLDGTVECVTSSGTPLTLDEEIVDDLHAG